MSTAEKTEKPTPQRLKKEARKGKNFNSRDLLGAAVLWTGALALLSLTSLRRVGELYVDIIRGGFSMPPGMAAGAALKAMLMTIAPVLGGAVLCVVFISLLMSGGQLAPEALKIDFTKLNPVTGAKNLFSLKVIKDLFRTVLYLLCASLFGWLALRVWGQDVFSQVHAQDPQLGALWAWVGFAFTAGLLLALAPVYLLAGWLDHWLFIRDMKMDKHEVKREHKDNQIKPELRKRRHDINEELSAQVQADTLGSTVVLANPTHVAIGIFLMSDDVPMPLVSVREKDARARKVIALAEANGIPVVRDVRLARTIHARSRRYQFVDDKSIDEVMAVVAWLRDVERAGKPPDADADTLEAPSDN